jgi:protein-disulfide isomerase
MRVFFFVMALSLLSGNAIARGPDDLAPPPGSGPLQAVAEPAPEAMVELVVFSDFQCPFCARVVPTIKALQRQYGKRLKVSFLHQPLPFHADARNAAIAAEAARRQGLFWQFHDKLFENQKNLKPSDLERYAKEVGLDMKRYARDVEDPALATIVDSHQGIANAVGATGTPTFFINGAPLKGAHPIETFEEMIDDDLFGAEEYGHKGDKWLRDRLKGTAPDLYSYLYEGKAPPKAEVKKAPADETIYKVEVDPKVDAIKGAKDALVTLVVFSEFQCPFCKKLEPTLGQLMQEYEGKIRLVFKHNPLPFHKDAVPAAHAALCAQAQGQFWEYSSKLWEQQDALDGASLEAYAGELGLDVGAWKACVAAEKFAARLLNDMELAQKVTARGTPNTFVNGLKMTGAKPIDEFRTVIDKQLAKANKLVESGIKREKVYDELIKDGKTVEPLEAKVQSFKTGASPMRGKKSAQIDIVMFGDFECPFTKRTVSPLRELEDKYGDSLSIVFKHFPLSFHESARPAALASVCAHAQGQFWQFHDKLFEAQEALDDDTYEAIASELGLDLAAFRACIKSGRGTAQVEADEQEAKDAGVRGTPTFFINGRKFNSPSGYSVDAFSTVIDKHILKKKP